MTQSSQSPPTAFHAITQKSTVSISLVVVIVGGLLVNANMMSSLKTAVSLMQRDVTHVSSGMLEIKSQLNQLGTETRSEIQATRSEVYQLRDQVNEAMLRLVELERQ